MVLLDPLPCDEVPAQKVKHLANSFEARNSLRGSQSPNAPGRSPHKRPGNMLSSSEVLNEGASNNKSRGRDGIAENPALRKTVHGYVPDGVMGLAQTDKLREASMSILRKTLDDIYEGNGVEHPDVLRLMESVEETTSRLVEENAAFLCNDQGGVSAEKRELGLLLSSLQDMKHQVGELQEKHETIKGSVPGDARASPGPPPQQRAPDASKDVAPDPVHSIHERALAAVRSMLERCKSSWSQDSLAALGTWASESVAKGLNAGSATIRATAGWCASAASKDQAAARLREWGLLGTPVQAPARCSNPTQQNNLNQLALALTAWTSGSISKLDVALLFMSRRILLGRTDDVWDQAVSPVHGKQAAIRAAVVLGAAELSWHTAVAADRALPSTAGRAVKPLKHCLGLLRAVCWASLAVLAVHEARKYASHSSVDKGPERPTPESSELINKNEACVPSGQAAEE